MGWLQRVFGGEGNRAPCPFRFEADGWRRAAATGPGEWRWTDESGDTLRISVCPAAPGHGSAASLDELRAHYRQLAARADASIVQVDPADVVELPALLVVTKARRELAADYTGRLLVPPLEPRYEIEIVTREYGITGTRDALVSSIMATCGEMELEQATVPGEPRRIKGYSLDPYDPAFDSDSLTAVSDDERLDRFLPWHPLSKLRATLAYVRRMVTVDDSVDAGPLRAAAAVAADDRPRRSKVSATVYGTLCFQWQHYDESERAFSEAIAEATVRGEAATAKRARQQLLLGLSRDRLGRYRDALTSFQAAETAALAVSPPVDPIVGQAVNNQARAFLALNEPAAAEPLFTRALALFEADGDCPPSNVAIALNGLGMARNAQGRHEEAIPVLEEALEIFETEHGFKFPDCADVLSNLAVAFSGKGDQRQAKRTGARADEIRKHLSL